MGTMTDADIHAFPSTRAALSPGEVGPGAAARSRREGAEVPGGATRRPRRWPWVLLAVAVLFVAGVVGAVVVLGTTLDQALGGLDIRIDGERLLTMPHGEAAWWAVAAGVLAGMVMLVVVPLSLLLALLVTVLVLATALVAVLAVGAIALSPLWVLALLLWLALRGSRRGPA